MRRALWFTRLNFALGVVLLTLTASNLVQLIGSGGPQGVALLFVGVACVLADHLRRHRAQCG